MYIKPLSVNQAWAGKRFKTPKYKQYERDVMLLLPDLSVPRVPLFIEFTFGFSNKRADIDNPVKPILDIMQKKFGFDDSLVYKMVLNKKIVPKGKEFIKFRIEEIKR